jgi:hypothetical protein
VAVAVVHGVQAVAVLVDFVQQLRQLAVADH